jgi:hypothetical protein
MLLSDIKLDDRVILYGYTREIKKGDNNGGPYLGGHMAFFNGAEMQVISLETEAYCTIAICRHFDLNENTIRDWEVHVGQLRKAK